MAFDLNQQEEVVRLDHHIDAATRRMIAVADTSLDMHIKSIQDLLTRRVELTRPEVFGRIEELLKLEI